MAVRAGSLACDVCFAGARAMQYVMLLLGEHLERSLLFQGHGFFAMCSRLGQSLAPAAEIWAEGQCTGKAPPAAS